MSQSLRKTLFVDHPSSVGETYFQHMRVAGGFAFWLILAGLAAMVHAVIPALFEKTARRIITRLHDRFTKR